MDSATIANVHCLTSLRINLAKQSSGPIHIHLQSLYYYYYYYYFDYYFRKQREDRGRESGDESGGWRG